MTDPPDHIGARTFFAEDLAIPEMSKLATGSVAVHTERSPDKENHKRNEDAVGLFSLTGEVGVIAIADGCGGMPRGGEAAEIAIDALRKSLAEVGDETQLRPAILNGVEAASTSIKDLGVGAATTLIVASIQGDTVRTYHVGDSELMIVGNRGKIRFQTISHSPVGYAVEAGLLTESGALLHEDRNLVSNLLGTDGMHIDIGPRIKLQRRDTLVLGSDGLFDNLRQRELVEFVRKGPLTKVAENLMTACRRRMDSTDSDSTPSKPDDLAFALFRMTQSKNG